ncbi:MAG: class I SAM-dependent methyltransferase [Polyangiaceae bacterium]
MAEPAVPAFSGSIPEMYQRYMVPLVFAFYAENVAQRARALAKQAVLETAAGTGVVTRQLASTLPQGVKIVATDLSPPMLAFAGGLGTAREVEWRQADALSLPFEDASFDLVVCQFGAMFFPDKAQGFAEARRVLRPGGTFLFSVWDSLEHNEFALAVQEELEQMFPESPPNFMARVPHGYHDVAAIRADIASGGFTSTPQIDTVATESRAPSADFAATALCTATPLRNEIEARDPARLQEATSRAAQRIRTRFGSGQVSAKIQAHIVSIVR